MGHEGNESALNEKALLASLSRDTTMVSESLSETFLRASRESQHRLAEILASDRSGS